MYSPRFQVKIANDILIGNSITGALPDPLDWSEIERLCVAYGAEAIVAIEIFDTDFIVTNGKRTVKKTIEDKGVKKEVEVEEYYAEGVGNITIGIRLYDPKAKNIMDQQVIKKSNKWEATGTSIQDALSHLIIKTEAKKHVGAQAGMNYAYKIAPMPVWITRQFYAKSKKADEIPSGARYTDVNDWETAIRTWENGLTNCNDKEGGRICYNLAIAYEVMGDLVTARQWANRAYTEYGNKKARDYSSVIEYRMYEEEKVRQQMK